MTNRFQRLVILGPPGSGKGTQGKLIAKALGLTHIASGDIVRHHQAAQTQLGKSSIEYYSQGLLVPDDITNRMVLPNVLECNSGFVLDGYPRNVAQAERLDEALRSEGLRLDQTLLITTPKEVILQRLANRRICRQCERVYHTISAPPQVEGKCDNCGAALQQRADDTPEAIETRFEEYVCHTQPLIDYYSAQGKLRQASGYGNIDVVRKRLLQCLGGEQNDTERLTQFTPSPEPLGGL